MTVPPARSGGIARAALLIAVVTVAARVLGFGRVAVFGHAVGSTTCLASAYYTANTLPNVLFEIVAGGALASAVVPVLAGAVGRGDAEAVRRTTAALLGWTVLVLVPLAIMIAVLAPVLVGAVYAPSVPGCDARAVVTVAGRMLVVFAPQVLLYGVAVVLTGVLQAHRRFLGPALAPLLSSLAVLVAYLLFGALTAGTAAEVGTLPRGRELILSVGTTLGVAALAVPLLLPVRRAGVRLGLSLTFPTGVGQQVRRLALAGVAALAAQQASVIAVLRLADGYQPAGGVFLYTLAWTLFLVPWAVLAVPIATSAFPVLSGRADAADRAGFAAVAASSTRAVVLASALGAAALAATAAPAARVLLLGTRGGPDPAELARAVVAFAPGLVGYGLVAHLGRALYAQGAGRSAASATVSGWLAVAVADVLLVPQVPDGWVIAALGVGNTLGMTVAGALLLAALARAAGRECVAGLPRASAAAVLAAGVASATGWRSALGLGSGGVAGSAAACVFVTVIVLAVYAAVALAVDRPDARGLAQRVLRA